MGEDAKVERFMEGLEHPHKDAVEYLRGLILGVDPKITEQVKWNAPSFCYDGVDRVTFQLKSKDVQLIFHKGAKHKDGSAGPDFVDDSGLMDWRTGDRAVVTFKDLADAKARQKHFVSLVTRWVKA